MVLGILILIIIYLAYTEYIRRPRNLISFRETLDVADLPIVTFKQGEIKLNFVLDTGANYSLIDKSIEETLKVEDAKGNSTIVGLGGNLRASMKVIKFQYKNREFTETFQVLDMTSTIKSIKEKKGATIHGILGNAFMQKYKYVLDFKEMIAYSRK